MVVEARGSAVVRITRGSARGDEILKKGDSLRLVEGDTVWLFNANRTSQNEGISQYPYTVRIRRAGEEQGQSPGLL